jgi:hypothetical protein
LHDLRSVFPLSLFGEFATEATLDLLQLWLAVVRLLDRDIQRVRFVMDHSYSAAVGPLGFVINRLRIAPILAGSS